MPDLSEILARPDVIRAVEKLIAQAAIGAGVSQVHAERIALGMGERLEEGEKVEPLVALAEAIRSADDGPRSNSDPRQYVATIDALKSQVAWFGTDTYGNPKALKTGDGWVKVDVALLAKLVRGE